ncbi:hypothetical protein ABIF70_008496 [Bradyrhizobium japonicum]
MASDSSQPKGKGMSLPGQPTEEAMAEVGSEAGKSLVRGLSRLGNAAFGGWISKREAKAEATRLAIETEAKIKAAAAVVDARRADEMEELEHRTALNRRAERFRLEMEREQLNLEAIERRALEYTESDQGNSAGREVDEDWLFRFADFAQKVSSEDVQAFWARALASAAIKDATRLSTAALQTLSLFDSGIAENFKKFVAVVARLGFVPYTPSGEPEPQGINVSILVDLGLVRESLRDKPYEFADFLFEDKERVGKLGMLNAHLSLTLRGREISQAVFRRLEDLPLSEDLEKKYLQFVLQQLLEQNASVTIVPKLAEGAQAIAIRLTKRNNITNSLTKGEWRSLDIVKTLGSRLFNLLVWAEHANDIEIK